MAGGLTGLFHFPWSSQGCNSNGWSSFWLTKVKFNLMSSILDPIPGIHYWCLTITEVSFFFVYLLCHFLCLFFRLCIIHVLHFHHLNVRFEAGTPAIGEAIGLGAAIDYLSGIGMQKIHDYEVVSFLFHLCLPHSWLKLYAQSFKNMMVACASNIFPNHLGLGVVKCEILKRSCILLFGFLVFQYLRHWMKEIWVRFEYEMNKRYNKWSPNVYILCLSFLVMCGQRKISCFAHNKYSQFFWLIIVCWYLPFFNLFLLKQFQLLTFCSGNIWSY